MFKYDDDGNLIIEKDGLLDIITKGQIEHHLKKGDCRRSETFVDALFDIISNEETEKTEEKIEIIRTLYQIFIYDLLKKIGEDSVDPTTMSRLNIYIDNNSVREYIRNNTEELNNFYRNLSKKTKPKETH